MVKLANDDPAAFAKLSKRIFAPNMKVCLYCRRLIYGKKDAGAGWRRTVIPELHAMGFRVTKHSECLLVMMKPSLDDLEKTQSQEFMTSDWTALKIRAEGVPAAKDLYDLAILIIQVDDLMWDGHSRLLIWIGDKLEKKFKLGEKGKAEHFNGAKMHFDGHRIGFSYPDQCTKMFNMHQNAQNATRCTQMLKTLQNVQNAQKCSNSSSLPTRQFRGCAHLLRTSDTADRVRSSCSPAVPHRHRKTSAPCPRRCV